MSTALTAGLAPAPTRRPLARLALLLPAGFALLAGLDAALLLLGLPAPIDTSRLEETHGMLMVLGFVGTLVSLERAVALRARPALLAPALLGLGAISLVTALPLSVGRSLFVAGSVAFVAVYSRLWRRQRDEATLVQTMGAVLALGASILWSGGVPIPTLVPMLVGFVVLTIAGERIELARIEMSARTRAAIVALCALMVPATLAAILWPQAGAPLTGLTMLAIAVAAGTGDVARRTIRARGLPRFSAACMLAGYGWLAVASLVWLVGGPVRSGAGYDAVLHAVFLGFTVSMILAHAPVILPAVLGRPLPYHRLFVVPAVLLHASLVVRVLVGDAWGHDGAWQVGGVLNIVAVLLFVGLAAARVVGARVRPGAVRP